MAQEPTDSRRMVLISTSLGDIKVALYNETPLHRDNFIKLVEDSFYDGSIFHRVINNFMIQGGGAPEGKENVNYTIPAEFNPMFIHKKGALAAARIGDEMNPKRASSGSQFYIVQGVIQSDMQLDMYSQSAGIKYTPEQRELYKTIGGTPHLDMGYTVFGEVVEGLEVVDKIASVESPKETGSKPLVDIKMTMKMLN